MCEFNEHVNASDLAYQANSKFSLMIQNTNPWGGPGPRREHGPMGLGVPRRPHEGPTASPLGTVWDPHEEHEAMGLIMGGPTPSSWGPTPSPGGTQISEHNFRTEIQTAGQRTVGAHWMLASASPQFDVCSG